MQITVRLFASMREKAGVSSFALELPQAATAAQAADLIGRRFPTLAGLLPRAAFAVNQAYVPAETLLHDGDELALIPPVSGG